jgi:D-aminopeptidase
LRPLTTAFRLSCGLLAVTAAVYAQPNTRPRARDLGIAPGVFAPGENNAITDVPGVRVGHATVDQGNSVHTGITAIIPHTGNAYISRVPAAAFIGNAFGKLVGSTQLKELGELETPILLTCTLCVWKAADAMAEWMLEQPGMSQVRSINPVVGETNDGRLNDIRSRPITAADVRRALDGAKDGPVEEGSVGAGRGTVAFGWKGGIGTSSRKLPAQFGRYTVGVLVQSNYGGILQMGGAPIGVELNNYAYRGQTSERGDGSVMVIVATDAPLSDRNLGRLAERAMFGIARTGSSYSNGSGDYAIAFSNSMDVRRQWNSDRHKTEELSNEAASALFEAAIEAAEEAAYNSILRATSVTGANGRPVEAIDINRVKEVLAKYRPR